MKKLIKLRITKDANLKEKDYRDKKQSRWSFRFEEF